jgi:hypothetical protein
MATVEHAQAKPGDVVVVSGHRQGEPERLGEILDVHVEGYVARFRVRWDDGHESLFFPGSDAHVKRSEHRARRRSGAGA